MDNKYGPPVCPCISVHSQPNRDPKNLKKNHGGWGFNEQSPDQVSVPCIVHSRGTELQNHDVRFFCFSLSSPSHFLNLAGAGPCSSPRRARLNAEKLALHGLESKRQRGTHTNERRRSHLNPPVVLAGARDGIAQQKRQSGRPGATRGTEWSLDFCGGAFPRARRQPFLGLFLASAVGY